MPKKKKTNRAKSTSSRKPGVLRIDGAGLMRREDIHALILKFKSRLSARPGCPVSLDCTGINKIYSEGIALVVGLYKECRRTNRSFSVEIADKKIIQLFKMLKLYDKMNVRNAAQ